MNNWASNICQDEFRDGSRDCKRRSQRRRCFQKKMRKIKVNLGFRSENEGVREWNRWTNKELVRTRQNYRAQETKRRPTNAYCRSEGFLFEDRASQQGREASFHRDCSVSGVMSTTSEVGRRSPSVPHSILVQPTSLLPGRPSYLLHFRSGTSIKE